MNKIGMLLAGFAGLAAMATPAWSAEALLSKPWVMAPMDAAEYAQVQRYYQEYPHVRIEEGLRLNTRAWRQNAFDVTLPSGDTITLNSYRRYATESGAEVVIARSARSLSAFPLGEPLLEESVLVNNDGLITATVRHQGKLYGIRSLESGQHLVVEIDESRMPTDHPDHEYAALFDQEIQHEIAARSGNDFSMAANTVIRLLVNYTPKAKNAVSNINGLIDLAIAETNQGYANSGISITVQLAHRAQTNYTESSSMSTDRDRYASSTDSYMNEIHTQRNTYKADVAVLILNNSSACGIAKAIGAKASTAFAVVHHSCATGYYSFAHEIGHLQGARHDPATDPSTSPYAYGHGYRAPNNKWRTVMAYNCSPACPRINYWSNPNKTYSDGQKMGTTSKSDNARVLNLTKGTVAGFR